jgi:MYND finger
MFLFCVFFCERSHARTRISERVSATNNDDSAQVGHLYSLTDTTSSIQAMEEPVASRVPQDDGSTKTLKMSLGRRKIDDNPDLARMLYNVIILNGGQYCRPHLLIRCHLCESDGWHIKEDADEEREELGLRMSGIESLDERAQKWSDLTQEALLVSQLQEDNMRFRYGENHAVTDPQHCREPQINDEFLQDTPKVSQCCYWACDQPNAEKLLQCSGCRIAKYCCKEHQKKDWKWEHKGECRLPQFLADEFAEARQRNLSGDYRTREQLLGL